MTNYTREQWLIDATDYSIDMFFPNEQLTVNDLSLSFGFAKGRAKAIGQCFARELSQDGKNHIFISPKLDDKEQILAVLIHELIHAVDNCRSGHKGLFKQHAKRIGFQTPLTQLNPSQNLKNQIKCMVRDLPELPHKQLQADTTAKKQSTRMLKIECSNCGFTFRTTQKHVDNLNSESPCPSCEHSALTLA